ncbi:hypothetical protein [Bacillus salipaludis]|uniref:Uncharacterized protein n=1 Tax=Bacillus salipaludis TaxID=2547811 RepID=A0ABW8RLP8_9BACI
MIGTLTLNNWKMIPFCTERIIWIHYVAELAKIKDRNKLIKGMHINSTYTAFAHFWLIQQLVQPKEWRFVTDDDSSLATAIYRVFSKNFRLYNAHPLCKQNRQEKIGKAKT